MLHPPRSAVLLSLAVALLSAAATAETTKVADRPISDWNRFRGPNGQGTASAFPDRLDLEPTLAQWRIPAPPGHSSPIVFGDRVFLTGAADGKLLTLAHRISDGQELWRRQAPRPRQETLDTRNGPAAPSPAVDASRVVVWFGDFGLLCYDHDGNELWRHPLGPFTNLYGVGASPVLNDDRVYLAVDQHQGSYLLALDAADGSLLWRTERPEAKTGHSTPVLFAPNGGDTQILVPGSFFLSSYRASDGERLWWVRGLSFEMKSTPAMNQQMLFINGYGSQFNEEGSSTSAVTWQQALEGDADGNGVLRVDEMPDEFARSWFDFNDLSRDEVLDAEEWEYFRSALETRNNLMAIRLPAAEARGDLTRSHVVWQSFRSVPQLPSPILAGDVLLMINDRGITTTFQAASGEVIERGRIDGLVDSIYASPVATSDHIYIAGRSGKVATLGVDGKLAPLAVVDFEEELVATPAITPTHLILRTSEALYGFTAPAGDER